MAEATLQTCTVNSASNLMPHIQLQELREELQRREARWSASLARYRLRVEALEAQNRELQGDLLVMEQERLTWWQQQVLPVGWASPISRFFP